MIEKALKINQENLNYYLVYMEVQFNKKFPNEKIKLEKFEDLINAAKNSEISKELILYLNILKGKYKSRVITRIEIALSEGDEFKQLIKEYLGNQIKQGIPSIFINLKFIYHLQSHKINIIDNIISQFLNEIKNNKKIEIKKNSSENEVIIIDIIPEFIWVYYFVAQHYYFLGDMENALNFINMALDKTPTVVEFYMLKSKIFEHSGLLDKSADAYEKARKLDLGDRYLNAKYAKKYVRLNNIEKSNEIMKEFVRDPLHDDNIYNVQCMWYEIECAYAYLRDKNIIRAHRLFNSNIFHFTTIVEDQVNLKIIFISNIT
jgi:tetratricopeptide (TPR) repeat protein